MFQPQNGKIIRSQKHIISGSDKPCKEGARPAGAEVPIGVKRLSISGQLNGLFHPASPKPILGWKSEMIENDETIQLVMRWLSP
jgi:hypothetical protein